MKHRITSKSTLKFQNLNYQYKEEPHHFKIHLNKSNFTQILPKNMYGLQVNPNNFGTYPINKLPERIALNKLFKLWPQGI